MSLVRIAVRMAAVEALKGRTLVGDNVLDSAIGAFQIQADGSLRTDQEGPFLAIYTDAAKSSPNDVRGLLSNGDTVILFEAGITAAMTETDPESGGSTVVGVGLPATDATYEYFIDMVMRQIGDALNNPDNTFGQIFSGLVVRIKSIERARTGNDQDGVKLAGQQIKLTVELMDDPAIGIVLEPGAPFDAFLTVFEASSDPDQVAKAQAMRTLITGAQGEDWEITQRHMGLTAAELLALGRGPVAQDEDRSTPEFDGATAKIDGNAPVSIPDE